MANILIVAEHDGNTLNPSTAKCVTCAQDFGADSVDVVVFAADGTAVAEQAAKLEGVSKVVKVDRAENATPLAAVLAPQIVKLADSYSHVLAPSTTFGKDVLPRAAALLGIGMVSDVMAVDGPYAFKRPVYAGNAIVSISAPEDRKLLATVRTASYAAAKEGGGANIEDASVDVQIPTHTRYMELKKDDTGRPDLQTANRVVAGGRALGSSENFELIYKLADKLGAGVGATRAAVDAGYVANDLQIGQTGKIIAPDLYIALGISGAIQHVTGIKDAGTIVAINKDAEAPIFEIADIGLVGDLFTIIPELEKALG
jgi:electron transfer flavoprotein alpha subunit